MAKYRMSLTRTDVAPDAIQLRKSEIGAETAFDLCSDETIMRAASRWADGVEPTLIAMGKKLGLAPRGGRDGKGDFEFGVNGSDHHPVEFWAQKIFV